MEKHTQLIHAQASQRHLHNSFGLTGITRVSCGAAEGCGRDNAPQVMPQPDKREYDPHAPKLRALPAQWNVPGKQEVRPLVIGKRAVRLRLPVGLLHM